jgi:hypothetical protein
MSTPLIEPSATVASNGEPQNATRLVAGIIDDATRLISQHVAMFRAEVRQDFKRSIDAAKYLGAGSLLSTVGLLFLAVSLVPLLNSLVPTLPMWSCWAIVGGALLLAGGIAFAIGKTIFGKTNPLPNQTLAAIQEDVSWITKPRT